MRLTAVKEAISHFMKSDNWILMNTRWRRSQAHLWALVAYINHYLVLLNLCKLICILKFSPLNMKPKIIHGTKSCIVSHLPPVKNKLKDAVTCPFLRTKHWQLYAKQGYWVFKEEDQSKEVACHQTKSCYDQNCSNTIITEQVQQMFSLLGNSHTAVKISKMSKRLCKTQI